MTYLALKPVSESTVGSISKTGESNPHWNSKTVEKKPG